MQRYEYRPIVATKGVDLTGLLRDIKEDWGSRGRKSPSGVQGQSPGRRSGDEETTGTHNICIKIQQTTVMLLLLDKISSKILGDITMDVPPS